MFRTNVSATPISEVTEVTPFAFHHFKHLFEFYADHNTTQSSTKDTIFVNKSFRTFLLAVQQVLAQISLGREGHFTEAALCYWLLLVLVFTAHFTNVFL